MKAHCELCGCQVKGDYESWMIEDEMITFKCKMCLAIDIKLENPKANVQDLLERDD